jgi:hypothetical protein
MYKNTYSANVNKCRDVVTKWRNFAKSGHTVANPERQQNVSDEGSPNHKYFRNGQSAKVVIIRPRYWGRTPEAAYKCNFQSRSFF